MLKFKLMTFVLFILFLKYQRIRGLQLTNIEVPEVVNLRDDARLACSYNLGNNKLNSVKWYKGSSEFYRFAPMMHPAVRTFYVDGIHLSDNHANVCNQENCIIHLDQLSKSSSASYRCEVSGDAPEFKIAHKTANMTVAVLPQYDPQIVGVYPNYKLNDFVVANCTSDMSSPPPNVYWYINDVLAPSQYLQPVQEQSVITAGFDLRYRSIEIRFYVDDTILGDVHGKVKLKCVSRLENFPKLAREQVAYINVQSMEELRNQKLINWRNTATHIQLKSSLIIANIFYLILHTVNM